MYVLAPNQTVEIFPFAISELRKDHSFSANPSNELLASLNVFPVVTTDPQFNPETEVATMGGCTYNSQLERWETSWLIREKSEQEISDAIAQRLAEVEAQRAEAYRNESDPLFFKAQRGEATQQEWLDKVAEIKLRYPA